MALEMGSLISKANVYKVILENTITYRMEWNTTLKPLIKDTLKDILQHTLMKAEIKEQSKLENLEAVILDLGKTSSGISENIDDSGVKRTMIKSNGSLIYQQLFNGKVMVMIMSPSIEGYGEPKAPRMLQILRPNELKPPLILQHFEAMLKEIIDWEDYDDDQPAKANIGFQPIGFNNREDIEQ
ncbi:MAG: hypothetical protein RLZZ546_2182 [Bacteroidota bacterium]|jgi:hypothetical protein